MYNMAVIHLPKTKKDYLYLTVRIGQILINIIVTLLQRVFMI